MIVSDAGQAKVFLINVLCGMFCVGLFDLFAVTLKSKKRGILWLNAVDAIYYLVAFVLVFYVGIKYNFGAFRYYQLCGLLLGIFLHVFLFSKIERKIFDALFRIIKKTISILKKITLKPLLFILRVIMTPILFGEGKILDAAHKCKKRIKMEDKRKEKVKKTIKKRIKML